MGDESCTNEFPNHCGEIWRHHLHPILEVLVELSSVVSEFNDLLSKTDNMAFIVLCDLGTH
jgi:hypothetical protein